MQYQIKLRPKAEKKLNSLSEKDYSRIQKTISAIAENPFIGKKLQGKLNGYRSVRVWPYRIIYFIHKRELLITIFEIAHRQGVYS